MRKRLRKKLRRGEFTQLGFNVRYSVQPGVATRVLDDLLDSFILQAVEGNDLSCGGGGGPAEWDFFVCGEGRRSAIDADRQRVQDWLKHQPQITSIQVGVLQDAWNGEDDAPETPGEEHAA